MSELSESYVGSCIQEGISLANTIFIINAFSRVVPTARYAYFFIFYCTVRIDRYFCMIRK